MEHWIDINENWVLIPQRPIGIVHFLGGAFIGAAPHILYRWLLEEIAKQGYVIITTAFINTFDHHEIAQSVLTRFNRTLKYLEDSDRLRRRYLPIYGLGHSMGCKLHLIIGSDSPVKRAGNILISYNNYPVNDAIPFGTELDLSRLFQLEFTPSPEETERIISGRYQIPRNLLIRFREDTIDQSLRLIEILRHRFPAMVVLQSLPGNHLTPLSLNISWQAGAEFSPIDAMGQWVQQEWFYKDLTRLKQEILRWLNPSLKNHG